MTLERRSFLAWSISAAGGMAAGCGSAGPSSGPPPAWAVTPVVGDGRWIDTRPPREPQGLYDQRPFELAVGIEMRSRGNATDLRASTPAPVAHPEQPIDDVRIETDGCQARVQAVGAGAAQLLVSAAGIAPGQVMRATARYRLTIAKQCFGHERDRFPARQPPPAANIRTAFLGNSPGIETSSVQVRKLLETIRGPGSEHPWDLARRCWTWVREQIAPRIGPYTSVVKAIENRLGDCEEMAAVFVALCRRAEIPARLVWVPNHNWAEFHLVDDKGVGHWIPAHTACYEWFGWTGVHELVVQKGDRVTPAHARGPQRLLEDWGQAAGPRPTFRWTAELKPLPETEGGDPGPGGRVKQASGEWALTGHRLDSRMRRH